MMAVDVAKNNLKLNLLRGFLKYTLFIGMLVLPIFCFSQKVDYKPWDALLKKHVSNDGLVDYAGFNKDITELNIFLKNLSLEQPSEKWTEEQLLSYYINSYNAYTIALILQHYPLKSIKEIDRPWGKKFIPINGKTYSLNDIEHDILRKMNDPRIHFAINCASISCPDLMPFAYTPEKLNMQLDQVSKSFINGPKNQLSKDEVKLSEIFKWYKEDFVDGNRQMLIDYISKYSNVSLDPKAKVSFLNYDWNLNESQK